MRNNSPKTCDTALAVLAALLAMASPARSQTVQPQPPVAAALAHAETGIWIDHTGRGAVEIFTCGAMLCGRVHWIKAPLDRKGRPMVDDLNPDAAKRGKPICGLQIIGNAAKQADGTWDNGWIYNPDDGGTFSVELQLRGADRLQVKGYAGVKFLNETYIWKRAPASLNRCAA